jgi:hypothetical protein
MNCGYHAPYEYRLLAVVVARAAAVRSRRSSESLMGKPRNVLNAGEKG